MKAVVITRSGGPDVLEVQERPRPGPGESQVLVRVEASALNRADLLQRRGSYPAPAGTPAEIPGLEYAGEVVELGAGADVWKTGDRVMGILGGGGHAEYVVVHERQAIPIPAGLSWEEAAAIPEAFLTAYDGLHQARARGGERVLIHAVASGVGTAAVQLAKAGGAETLGTSRSPQKLERCRALGLDHPLVESETTGWEEGLTRLSGEPLVDLVLDLVGGGYLTRSVRVMRERGRLVLIGLVAGTAAELDLGLILSRRLTLIGSVLRSRPLEEKITLAGAFTRDVIPLLERGQVRPVIDRVLPFASIAEAHRSMERNDSFGKLVLTW